MSKPWFAPKRFGYGSGLPVSWEGWVVLIVFVAGFTAIPLTVRAVVPERPLLPAMGAMAIWLVAFVPLFRAKTEGGWRWRSGKGD